MGVISKLKSQQPQASQAVIDQPQASPAMCSWCNTTHAGGPENCPPDDDDQPQANGAATRRPAPQPAAFPLPPPMPCLDCGSAVLWLDSYDNAHCGQCEPPPAKAFVVGKIVLAIEPDGSLTWDYFRGPGRPGQ